MSQETRVAEGLVLRVIPFREDDRILSLFTQEAGMIKAIDKGVRRRSHTWMPLTKVEIVYRESKGEIFTCCDMTLVDPLPLLRTQLPQLQAGCDMVDALLTSQMMGKAAPALYALLCCYLEKIAHAPDPWALAISFRVKLLRHDGWVALPFRCGLCGEFLEETAYLRQAESWCPIHRPTDSTGWDKSVLETLYRLALSQSYREICETPVSLALQERVIQWFALCVTP